MLKWSDQLSIGVEEIDNQHKELINRCADLLSAMAKGKGKDEVAGTLNFLTEYAVFHFNAEEKIMKDNAYPGFAHHKQQHEYFTGKVAELKDRLNREGPTSSLAIQAQRLLSDWLVNHISVIDSALGAFLLEKK
ncbi:MAG TPA: hemerythrin family protein [Firmicutes bacterium]|nr:hemerythrin family protein [Candidatus Fermentithermobacillaceae bacterium]